MFYCIPIPETAEIVSRSVEVRIPTSQIDALIETLLAGSQAEVREVREALIACGARAVPRLINAVSTAATDKERWRVLTTLAEIGEPEIVPTMIDALTLSSSALSAVAAQCLATLRDPRAIDPMLNLLAQRPSPPSAVWLISALGKLEAKQAIEPLRDLLHTTHSVPERYTIIEVLGRLGNPAVIEDIRRYETDPDQHVRERVQAAIAHLQQTSLI
jgi:HEAT repeat protein